MGDGKLSRIKAQDRDIMRHILPDEHFLTTKKLRFTKDEMIVIIFQFYSLYL